MTHTIIETTSILLLIISISSILLNFRNLIIFLITIEIIILTLCLALSTHTHEHYTISIILILKILTIAAAETALALSILTTYYRTRGTISIKSLNLLRG
uniref:NADH-ubiquinone oxidoreductase chain 4L n=1 Tax=Hertwigia falcifera TaxID=1183871 RepID=A0A0N7AFS8_HERFA|nr:NADH dehydrogenase subunit 4L [Hertwigia falcifera]